MGAKGFTNGGKREGAGRKVASHTIEAATAKARMVERVSARTDELVDKLFEKALSETGDIVAIKELLDRGYGKPAQSTDLTTGGDKLNSVLVRFLNGENN